MYILLAFVGLIAAASANDLAAGHPGGKLIFQQNFTASPAIYKQTKQLFVNASDSEVITHVVIIDHREDKNGEATIVSGGEGYNNVTIELKSPTIFRGYDFEVRVYAKQENDAQRPVDNDQQNIQGPNNQDTIFNDGQVPKDVTDFIAKGVVTGKPSTEAPNGQDKVQHPVVVDKDDNQQIRPNRDTKGQETEQKPLNPTILVKDVQTEDKSNDSQVKDNKGIQQTKEGWQPIFGDILNVSISTEKTVAPTTVVESSEDTQNSSQDNLSVLDITGHGSRIPPFKAPTTKAVEGQQTEKPVQIPVTADTQQTKVQHVPLPYVKQ